MRYDILLAGVGGQGVLSMAALIGRAALAEGLYVKQSEVHGMSQRGGAVQAHLRLSDRPVESDLIPIGTADLILSLEPVESLRYVAYLGPQGTLVTASNPFLNIPNYPPLEEIVLKIRSLPRSLIVDAERIASDVGEPLTLNTVMVGAVTALLPLRPASLERAVRETFGPKGDSVVAVNLAALRGGLAAATAAAATAAAVTAAARTAPAEASTT